MQEQVLLMRVAKESKKCFHFGKPGHIMEDCRLKKNSEKKKKADHEKRTCYKCDKVDLIVEEC